MGSNNNLLSLTGTITMNGNIIGEINSDSTFWVTSSNKQRDEFITNLTNIFAQSKKEKKKMDYKIFQKLDSYLIVANLAGFAKEDVDIQCKDEVLYLSLKENKNYIDNGKDFLFNVKAIDQKYCALEEHGTSNMKMHCLDDGIFLPGVDENLISATIDNGLLKITAKKIGNIKQITIK